MEVIERLRALLTDRFPAPDKVELDDEEGIHGAIISTQFEGMETIDRINLIWDLIDQSLTTEERRHIQMIIPVTPEEAIAHST